MKPLHDLLNSYPSYQPNQVLTSESLNRLADYLDQQDRLTRQKLIGIGIVCGLEVHLDTSGVSPAVTIQKGAGITSEGFLICLDRTVCTHVRPFKDKAGYPPFVDPEGGEPYEFLEIMEDPGQTNDATISKLSNAHIGDRVVLLYLEILEIATDKCLEQSCDEKGKRWQFVVRKLLVTRSQAESIRRAETGAETPLNEFFHPEYELPPVHLERFGFQPDGGDPRIALSGIETLDQFVKAYLPALRQGGVRLARALHRMHRLYRPLFELQLGTAANPFAGFDRENPDANALTTKLQAWLNQNPLAVQYLYDLLLDLKATYDELSARLFELVGCCSPDPRLFPRHLMLGELEPAKLGQFDPGRYDPPSPLRHFFIPAPIHDHQSALSQNVRQLIQRLVLILSNFDLGPSADAGGRGGLLSGRQELRITPGKDCSSPLGKQAIPFYYRVADGDRPLFRFWDFDAAVQNRSAQLLSYHFRAYGDPENTRGLAPLAYAFCDLPKLRIEGHVGKTLTEAIELLRQQRRDFNLPFDIIALKLDSTFDSVHLPDDSKIADLRGAYLTHRNNLVCCLRDLAALLRKFRSQALRIILALMASTRRDDAANQPLPIPRDQVESFYRLFEQSLAQLEQSLPLDLKDFDLHQFRKAHRLTNSLAALVRNFIDTFKCSSAGSDKSINPEILRQLMLALNTFDLFLARITDECLLALFETIHNCFVERVENISIFSRFASTVPGMEHIAGTLRGGTFILVYEDGRRAKSIHGTLLDASGAVLPGALVTGGTSSVITDSYGKFEIAVSEDVSDLRIELAGFQSLKIPVANEVRLQLTMARADALSWSHDPATNFRLFLDESDLIDRNLLAPAREEPAQETYRKIDFSKNENYRVVADFCLPCCLPGERFGIPLKEVCPPEGRPGLVDFQQIVSQLSKAVRKSRGVFIFQAEPKH